MTDGRQTACDWQGKVALVAFAKNPEVVPVKTRLARSLGEDLSKRIYVGLLEDCLSSLQSIQGTQLYLACYPDDSATFFKNLEAKYGMKLLCQEGADLGERMLTCIKTLLASHRAAIVFGTDVAVLPVDSILKALSTMALWDVILGPSRDGGYYAVGAKTVHDLMFAGVNWGAQTVFIETVKNCADLGLEVAFLDVCDDVDDIDSLRRLGALLELQGYGAEATRALLKDSGLLPVKA